MSPLDSVIMGREQWLFAGFDSEIRSFTHSHPFLEHERARLRACAHLLKEWSDEHGIPFLFVIIPNKSTVYDDYMPGRYVRCAGRRSRREDAVEVLQEAGIRVMDLTPVLRESRQTGDVFQKYDTHWNQRGAYIGANQILSVLQSWLPSVHTLPPAESLNTRYFKRSGDLARMLGLQKTLIETACDIKTPPPPPHKAIGEPPPPQGKTWHYVLEENKQPYVTLYHDSFGTMLIKYLLSGNVAHLQASWNFSMQLKHDAKSGTQVIICCLVERMLHDVLYDVFDSQQLQWIMRGRISACDMPGQLGKGIPDFESPFGVARQATPNNGTGFLLFGRYINTPPGSHEAIVRLKYEISDDSPVADIDVVANKGRLVLAKRQLSGSQTPSDTGYCDIRLPFEAGPEGAGNVECRVFYHGNGSLTVDSVTFNREATAGNNL